MGKTQSYNLFLAGGYDLEMLTIIQMLEERDDCVVADHHLRWDNAQLSVYSKELIEFADADTVYGIELQEDIPAPPNYHRIDHHNDYVGRLSALEQVATILGVSLNRFQQLVAANDKGYIPAMIALSATKEEIDDIRRKDRAAQGITEADEMLAKQSIAENLLEKGDLLVVRSLTPHFAAVCDGLFPYRSLLVYSDSEWSFYGVGTNNLVQLFAEEIRSKKMYYGGGKDGYIGVVKHAYTAQEIKSCVEQIIRQYEYIQLS